MKQLMLDAMLAGMLKSSAGDSFAVQVALHAGQPVPLVKRWKTLVDLTLVGFGAF